MSDVATELAASASGLSLGASRVRDLANKASGPISLSDLRGRQRGALEVGYFATSVNEGGVDYPYYIYGKDTNVGSVSQATLLGANIQVMAETERQGHGYRSLFFRLGGSAKGKAFFPGLRINGVTFLTENSVYASVALFGYSGWTWPYSNLNLAPGVPADFYFL